MITPQLESVKDKIKDCMSSCEDCQKRHEQEVGKAFGYGVICGFIVWFVGIFLLIETFGLNLTFGEPEYQSNQIPEQQWNDPNQY
ncbi:MAG: hypothetical protein AAFX78_09230 [Cyanobacteria bacterium J06638_20]